MTDGRTARGEELPIQTIAITPSLFAALGLPRWRAESSPRPKHPEPVSRSEPVPGPPAVARRSAGRRSDCGPASRRVVPRGRRRARRPLRGDWRRHRRVETERLPAVRGGRLAHDGTGRRRPATPRRSSSRCARCCIAQR